MADEIVELNNGIEGLVIVGIQRRGVQLAAQIVSTITAREGVEVPQGALDITLYRDDLQTVGPRPLVGQTRIPVDIDGMHVVIVDDVLYTGRTIRAALDELADFGRPRRIGFGRTHRPRRTRAPDPARRHRKENFPRSLAARRRARRRARWTERRDHRRTGAFDVTLSLGKDLLGLEPLSSEQIQLILDTAEPFKEISERAIKKVPTLRSATIVNLFFEPSTRTRISFEFAEKRLSADSVNVAASGSSVSKGETLVDTARNLEACASTWSSFAMARPVRRGFSRIASNRTSSTPATERTSIRRKDCSTC